MLRSMKGPSMPNTVPSSASLQMKYHVPTLRLLLLSTASPTLWTKGDSMNLTIQPASAPMVMSFRARTTRSTARGAGLPATSTQ
ncbi:hypothetical protein FOQG_19636 [Fusarium oxysporum f. sp. raphani 54005]|uniref:Uncharacterized protein n=1 Tax=Fusarium oxysporum f. sp. raphani 54005 TaxID=1089458 RepID=X0BYH9_FUSOX|nr:hypothetical protein FOQG_19636 [Fusarium oxysporum f. sp. raphani 54005]